MLLADGAIRCPAGAALKSGTRALSGTKYPTVQAVRPARRVQAWPVVAKLPALGHLAQGRRVAYGTKAAPWPAHVAGVRSGAVVVASRLRATAAAASVREGIGVAGGAVARCTRAGAVWLPAVWRSAFLVRKMAATARAVPVSVAGPSMRGGDGGAALPELWRGYPLPVGYIGAELAALALLRGEAWARDGASLTIGGRVLVWENGRRASFQSDKAAQAFVHDRERTAGAVAGRLAGVGSEREAWLAVVRESNATRTAALMEAANKVLANEIRSALMADAFFLWASA